MGIYTATNQNAVQKTLDATLSVGATSMTLNESVAALLPNIGANNPVTVVVDRIDANGNVKTDGSREYITATGVSGAVLSGLTRNADGSSSDQEHAVGAIVEFVPDVLFAESVRSTFETEHNADGTHATDAIDTITEIASGLKSGVDTKLITGTAGTNNYTSKWNSDGDLVDGYEVLDEDDMASDSATKLATQQSIKAYVDANTGSTDGWIDATSETWTYASATSFTIASVNKTAQYTAGTRLKMTQSSTVKYFVVTSSSFSTNTTVNVAANNDYSIANSAITANYYSYAVNPQGYPTWFGYDPTYTGFSTPPVADQQYRIDGNMFTLRCVMSGTSNSATFNFTVPVTPSTVGGGTEQFIVTLVDNGASKAQPGIVGVIHASSTIKVGIDPSTRAANAYGGFTASGGKGMEGTILFRFSS